MASLKEIKGRINSVNSTRKITSAMKMIASAKLHKAQVTIQNFLPYQKQLDTILTDLLAADISYDSPFTQKRDVKRVGIVVFTSNTTLCGAFNANTLKEFRKIYKEKESLGKDNILVFPIGKQVADAIKKVGIEPQGDYSEMAERPSFEAVQDLAKNMIAKYTSKDLDEIIIIYHHFKSVGTQVLTTQTYLPFDLASQEQADENSSQMPDYIFEPSKEEILDSLIPTVLYSRLYAALLDSNASEHAARTMAMQIATDNADDLLQELNVQYNKTRQYAVTSELLDIMGGVSALQ